jgi:hypothetical protein
LEADGSGPRAFSLATTHVVRMRANCRDAPYEVDKGAAAASAWAFALSYAPLDEVLPAAYECLAASRLPPSERCVGREDVRARALPLLSIVINDTQNHNNDTRDKTKPIP